MLDNVWLVIGTVGSCLLAYLVYILTPDYDDKDKSFGAYVIPESDSDSEPTKRPAPRKSYDRQYSEPGRQILVLYATEYGFSQQIAETLFDRLETELCTVEDWQPRLLNVRDHNCIDWSQEQLVIIIISTSGDGVPPTEARDFYNTVMSWEDSVGHLKYCLLALGDSNYPHYCRTGRNIDSKLAELCGSKLVPCVDIDQEDWASINMWLDDVIIAVPKQQRDIVVCQDYIVLPTNTTSGYSRSHPFMATLKMKYDLTTGDKDTIHCELCIAGSDLTWQPGDAVGIYPQNNASDVDLLLEHLGFHGNQQMEPPKWASYPQPDGLISVHQCLKSYYDLKYVNPELLVALKKSCTDTTEQEKLDRLLAHGVSQINLGKDNRVLHEYLHEREVWDVLADFPYAVADADSSDLLPCLKPLQPRYYSIASSPNKDKTTVCVTAAVMRYNLQGQGRTGVTTTFLQDRLPLDAMCPVFISHNPDFRLPLSASLPIIMIGPGTGIAPFRAFLQEREHQCATGQNHLYFGCRHKDEDFLYRSELKTWQTQGHVTLRTAFSRDQPHKVYVQHVIEEDASLLWQMLEQDGAHIYVCGDAKHMAHDVHNTLKHVIMHEGHMTQDHAQNYLDQLEVEERYQKDVWVT